MALQSFPSLYEASKCFVTYGRMSHLDPGKVPSKGKPWSSIMSQDFNHKVDLIIPEELFESVGPQLLREDIKPSYSRVSMSLSQVLEKGFFTEYIKNGNVIMLSDGNNTADNMFTLCDGILTMYLDKETYERAGLVGKPFGPRGNRGLKPRWVVSYNLREPSMVHGKKGFERLLYASRNVLDTTVTWLFARVSKSVPTPDPLEKLGPVGYTSSLEISESMEVDNIVGVPMDTILADGSREHLEDLATELHEWFSLLRLGSPRVITGDKIDPYLSRYAVPTGSSGSCRVRRLTWRGFHSKAWVRDRLVDLLTKSPSHQWFYLSATSFSIALDGSCDEVAMFRRPNNPGEYLMWEIGHA